MKTLKITGKAVLKGKPDTFVISFPVEELRADHIDAMQRLNKKVEKLREVLVRKRNIRGSQLLSGRSKSLAI